MDRPAVPRDLYPFDSHYLDLNGLGYHYLDEGSGHPVLMVHGNPTWSFYYRNLALALRDTHRVIVPDHMGCGLSAKPTDDQYSYTLEQRVDDLDALVSHLNLQEPLTLVLHDWGGMIGMAWASRHPDKVARIVLLNTGAFHLPETKPLPWQLWLVRNTSVGALLVRGMNAFSAGATRMACTRKTLDKKVRAAYTAPYNSWHNRIATLRFVQDIPLEPGDVGYDLITNVQDNLSQFDSKPIMICWGDKDFVFDHHFLTEWQKHLPNAQVHRFADCGHYILEDADEEVITLVQEFLSSTQAETSAA